MSQRSVDIYTTQVCRNLLSKGILNSAWVVLMSTLRCDMTIHGQQI